MTLSGRSIIGFGRANASQEVFHGIDAKSGERLEPAYSSATDADLDRAVHLAAAAFPVYRSLSRARRVAFLKQIAANLDALGDPVIERDMRESALPEPRVRGEMARTSGQFRFFAGIVEEGSWVDARIDTADPDRKPAPKPDVRSMLRPLGPVGIFGASNFPLAFSVAGGDTASALAAGNPVVVNAHFGHPGTSEMCGEAIRAAAEETGMPEGVFSLLFSMGYRIGQRLVEHPGIKGVGFTGSRRGGTALSKIAQSRPEPIPFYAEMGSVNPVFVLPHALAEKGTQIAAGLHASVTLGVGQFCTNPGVVLLPDGGAGDEFSYSLVEKMKSTPAAAMLNAGILDNYAKLVVARSSDNRVRALVPAPAELSKVAAPALFEADAKTFLESPDLADEVFGPSSVLVRYGDFEDALAIARTMEGNLTATIHSAPGDEAACEKLVTVLEGRVGRILFQGFPTGLEVCQAVVHGGPFPATSDGRSTSVGGRAIERFARLVCYQDAPQSLLPEDLQNSNPAGVQRVLNGVRTRDGINRT